MLPRSIISIIITALAVSVSFGQSDTEKQDKQNNTQAFAFTLDGSGGYLGVQTIDVTKENFGRFGLSGVRGVGVEKVIENSPAAAAGIQNGDVILRLNGEAITSTRKLQRLVSEISPDHQVTVTVVRGGREMELNATLTKRPGMRLDSGNFDFQMLPPMDNLKDLPQLKDMPNLKDIPKGELPNIFGVPDGDGRGFIWRSGNAREIGAGITPLTKQLAQHFGVEHGVMIDEVRDDSPASKSGLKAGDIVIEADGAPVKGQLDLVRAINANKEGAVQLTVVRQGARQTITVTPEPSKGGSFFYHRERGGDGPPALFREPRPMTPPAGPPPPVMNLFGGRRIV